MDHILRPALQQRHVQRLEDQIRPQVVPHRPADHSTAPRVHDDRYVQEPAPRWHIRDVGHPELVRSLGREVTLHQIRRRPGIPVTLRRAPLLATGRTLQAGQPHQATHTLVVDSPAVVPELGLHPRLAVRLSAEAVDLTHPTQQLLVIDRPRRG